ncbi:hypothetical protein P8631_23370, partial [Guyparkeria sp. 1SP6A2]|nr:hypothetical protein [Guyparkeria sp. 1SP6A2]
TKVKDGIYFDRLDVSAPTATGQDGRAIYWNDAGRNSANTRIDKGVDYGISTGTKNAVDRFNRPTDIGDVLVLRNTDKG